MGERERIKLVQAAVGGDGDALQRLIVHYHGPLCGTIDGLMDASLRRHFDTEDILQSAYAAAFQSIQGCVFEGPGGFYKWLERIALNQLKETQRNLHRRKRDIDREQSLVGDRSTSYLGLAQRVAASDSTPSRRLAQQEVAAAVISSLARLTDEQRAVVRMRFLENRPVADIAMALDKTEDAIHMLCHRSLKKLREFMGSITRYLSSQ